MADQGPHLSQHRHPRFPFPRPLGTDSLTFVFSWVLFLLLQVYESSSDPLENRVLHRLLEFPPSIWSFPRRPLS